MFRICCFATMCLFIGCKSNSNSGISLKSDTTAVEINTPPEIQKKLTGQELLDSFAEEYYLHYPDNVSFSETVSTSEDKDPRKFYKLEDFEAALPLYLVQVKLYPDVPYVNFYTGMSAYNAGEYNIAIEHFEKAQSKFPDDKYTLSTYFYIGLSYLRIGEVDKCKLAMNEYLDKGGIMTGRCSMLFQDLRLKWEPEQAKQDSILSQP